jgi:hypothetical protein
MSNSEYNKITSTIDSITRDFTYSPDSNNLVCIDTSNSRIGINTLDPLYSLHISGGSIFNSSLTVREISNVSLKFVINDITTKLDNLLTNFNTLLTESINTTLPPYPPLNLRRGTYSFNTGSGTILWDHNSANNGYQTITGYRITIGSGTPNDLPASSTSYNVSLFGPTTITLVAYNNLGASDSVSINLTVI